MCETRCCREVAALLKLEARQTDPVASMEVDYFVMGLMCVGVRGYGWGWKLLPSWLSLRRDVPGLPKRAASTRSQRRRLLPFSRISCSTSAVLRCRRTPTATAQAALQCASA